MQYELYILIAVIGIFLILLLRPPVKPRAKNIESEIRRIEVIDIDPNDTVVITCDRHLSAQQCDKIRNAWETHAKIGKKILVLDGGLSIDVLRQTQNVVVDQAPDDCKHKWIEITSFNSPKNMREFLCSKCKEKKTEPMDSET